MSEENSNSQQAGTNEEEDVPTSSTSGSRQQQQAPAQGANALLAHITRNKVDFALWSTRFLTIVFTLNYLIPILGYGPSMYSKALLANAATSALRLHQRLPRVSFSREFFGQLFIEDSAHYLLYSMMFLYSPPITWVLLPIFLFALLHMASYTLELVELLGPNSMRLVRMGIGLVEAKSASLLRTVSFSEIFLFPMILISLFSGRATLMTAFVYYRFLTMRYASRRNPYTRNAFYELRIIVESYIHKPGCPEAIRNLVSKAIALISRQAPLMATAQ